MSPLIPYVHLPEIPLSFLNYIPLVNQAINPAHPPTIKPFGTLVALGVYIGSSVAMRHARQRGLNEKKMSEFIFWVVGMGFIGGHVLDAIFYHPASVVADPLYLIKLWEGLSSYGGFVGALCGGLAWRFSRKEPILGYVEVIASAFPLAWVFGRSGCASVHDHPGRLSNEWFAVQLHHLDKVRDPWFAGRGQLLDGFAGRFDLGLIEMSLTIPLAVAFWILWQRKPQRPLGFYTGFMCAAYAPVRFVLDFFRESDHDLPGSGDPRYGGLTPAQWGCIGLFALGLYFIRMWKQGRDASEETTDPTSAPQIEVALSTGTASILEEVEDEAPIVSEASPSSSTDAPTPLNPRT